jgi:nucleoside-diphosphate-sugar epimerase
MLSFNSKLKKLIHCNSQRAFHNTDRRQSVSKKIVVFGGSGYVGKNVIKNALSEGIQIVSVSRSGGGDKFASGSQNLSVKWVSGDLLSGSNEAWIKELEGADGAVSCIGGFGSNDYMEKINGDANINAVNACRQAGIQRFSYISTVENNLPDFILRGYSLFFFFFSNFN